MSQAHPSPPGSGVIPPLVTPWTDDDRLDVEGLARLIDELVDAGVQGLFVLGTTGEGPALSMQTRRELVTHAVQLADGRAPVLVGVTDSSVESVLTLADHAAEAGASGVVLAPPPYSPVDAAELCHYLDHVAARLTLPMYLYNIPSRTGAVPMSVVRHAMNLPGCVGFKDSSGSMVFLHEALLLRDQRRPDFRVLVGPEELLAEAVLFGADGGVAGGANLFPRLFVRLYQAARRGDLPEARRLHRVVLELSTSLYRSGRYASSFIKSVKHGLAHRGICRGNMIEPYEPFAENDTDRLDHAVKAAERLVQNALATPAT